MRKRREERSKTLTSMKLFIETEREQHIVSEGFIDGYIDIFFNHSEAQRCSRRGKLVGGERGGEKYIKAMPGEMLES